MTFMDRLNSSKFDFTQNLSGGKMIKLQQNQALTSHFESFWSIVDWYYQANDMLIPISIFPASSRTDEIAKAIKTLETKNMIDETSKFCTN